MSSGASITTGQSGSNRKFLTKKEVADTLGQTCSGIDKLRVRDVSFPKPLRYGDSRQSRVYFNREEVEAWLRTKLDQRGEAA